MQDLFSAKEAALSPLADRMHEIPSFKCVFYYIAQNAKRQTELWKTTREKKIIWGRFFPVQSFIKWNP